MPDSHLIRAIVSYDGTYNEDDALALGRILAQAGVEVSLAYVRHTPTAGPDGEALAEHEAQELLRRGAALMGGREVGRHVVSDRSTPEGLRRLAERVDAQLVVFCSDSHTADGHIAIGNSARRLLEGGPLAVAIAPAGLAKRADSALRLIALGGDREDGSAQATAESLAASTGAAITSLADESADLLVIGSRADARPGRVALTAAAEKTIEEAARCPVLVLPRGGELRFVAEPPLAGALQPEPTDAGTPDGSAPAAIA